MQTLSALGNAPLVDLQAPTGDGLNATRRDEISEVNQMKKLLFQSSVLLLLLALSGCAGTKVLKEPEPLVVTQALATASDQRVAATLDWVIVRDGPGTWARNVDWDEYLIRVQNLSNDSIRVTSISVLDSLGTRIETREKAGTETHGSSLPPRSHGRLPEGPQDRRAAAIPGRVA